MKPTIINLSDDIKTQTITALEGSLKTQTSYTQNAVAEVMRLRSIIAKCDKCRVEANTEVTGDE